jgi:trimethylamine--corrinoid protein Co-methyltransferase
LNELKQVYELACISVGGAESLEKQPTVVVYLELISPLKMDRSSTERLLFCAEKNLPILYAAGANCGSSAPITPEGGVVQGSAECLAGLVLAALKNETIQLVYGANTSAIDLHSTIVCYGDPTWFRTVAMYSDMGRFYKLPSWGTAGSSDSFRIDAQAAMEAYEGISLVFMSGTTMAHDVGYLGHGELYDARMLILTDMMIGRMRHLLKRADLSEDALAVKVIDEVSRSDGVYLAHPHTLEKFREALWLPPKYFNRKHMSAPPETELNELLSAEVDEALAKEHPPGLKKEIRQQINNYVKAL